MKKRDAHERGGPDRWDHHGQKASDEREEQGPVIIFRVLAFVFVYKDIIICCAWDEGKDTWKRNSQK